jgi:hypothetical protein
MDHRLALVALSALILAAGASLAVGWAALLPTDPEPFERRGESVSRTKHSRLAIAFLTLTTLSYVVRLPGVPLEGILPWLSKRLLAPWPDYLFLGATFFLVFAPAFAACYALLRPSSLRAPLVASGVLVLLLWLLVPYLTSALLLG